MIDDSLVVYAGQDQHLLATDSVCTLHLSRATWEVVAFEQLGPRIDACATAIPGTGGLLVFGGAPELGSVPPLLHP